MCLFYLILKNLTHPVCIARSLSQSALSEHPKVAEFHLRISIRLNRVFSALNRSRLYVNILPLLILVFWLVSFVAVFESVIGLVCVGL